MTKGVNFLAHSSVRHAARLSLLRNDRAVPRFLLDFFFFFLPFIPLALCIFFSLFSLFAFYSFSIVHACIVTVFYFLYNFRDPIFVRAIVCYKAGLFCVGCFAIWFSTTVSILSIAHAMSFISLRARSLHVFKHRMV